MNVLEEVERWRPKLLEEFQQRFPQLALHRVGIDRLASQPFVHCVFFEGRHTKTNVTTTFAFDEGEPWVKDEVDKEIAFRKECAFRDLEQLLIKNDQSN